MSKNTPGTASGHLSALDGLRGAMAYWVLMGHAFWHSGMVKIPILSSPKYAVQGFMLLSGFLMTWHYVRREAQEPWTDWRTWTSFYVRRYFRISPLYYLLLIPSYLMLPLYRIWRYPGSHDAGMLTPVSWEHVLAHLSYAYGLSPQFHASMPIPDWSISLEMQFYLVFPFLMLLVLRFGWTAVSVLCGGIWFVANLPQLGYAAQFEQPAPLCLSLIWFAIGMVWAGEYARRGTIPVKSLLVGFLLVLVTWDLHGILLGSGIGFVLFTSGQVPVLGTVANRLRILLSSRIAVFMADASYSVYLIHLLVLRPVAFVINSRLHFSENIKGTLILVVTTGLSYSAAVLLHPLEEAGISIGRKIAKSLRTPRANAAASLAVEAAAE
jgi:peptidoglycan/LPS O-acetylase OafA/YrhL